MEQLYYTLFAGALVVILVAATGRWRRVFALFGIRRSQMTIKRLGFIVRSPADIERVNGILDTFSGGFNRMISAPSMAAVDRYCDALPWVYQPFAREGAAMGYTLRRLGRYNPAMFEERIVRPCPQFRYLSYVGVGFYAAMRDYAPNRLTQMVQKLDPLYGHLCYDGYGFKHGFFDYLKDPRCLEGFDSFQAYAKNVLYQGLGRSFWFLFMGDYGLLIEHIARLGDYGGDGAAGVGLASVFVNPDRLEIPLALGLELPREWHDDFHLGMCFGLKARLLNDPERFAENVGRLDTDVQKAINASVGACDRIENQVRAEGDKDGYRQWRYLVTCWMADHVAYPLSGVSLEGPEADDRESAPTGGKEEDHV